ncbi:MAG: phosphatase PAP2 family protein, partial [Chloroflexota bacterium]|nr:phosphatase PAP2 family protein [Chloroflexota bacterium]
MMHAKPQTESPSDITSSRADGADAERSYFRVVIVLFAAYLILATGLFYFRGFRSPTPDRWAPFLFLAALALGRGRAFVRDWIPFVALLFGYQYMRGVAGQVADVGSLTATDHGQVQLDFLLDAERWLFGGAIPSIWLQQRLFREGDAQWYDVVSGLVYLLHFVFPLVFAFGLWIRNKDHYWRFIIALAAMSYVSFLFFLLLPTAPPWLAQEWGVIQGLERPSGQAYRALLAHRADNFDTFQLWTKASPNPVAAFPSLHAAYPWLVMLFARRFFGRLGWSFILYNIAVWFCIVYFGLHWAVDIIAGIALATAVFVIMERLWPRLVGFQGVTWPAPLTVTVAGTQSIVASGAAAVHRRIITHPLARDLLGVFVVATIASTTFLYILQRGGMVGINSALQFYPGYDFLGDQLASGHLPAWMPHWYGGMPFIADPQSGWMYLPAMVIFTLFPLKWAIQLFLAAHVLLVGLGAYTLGRVLGLGVVAAVVAAAAFQLNGWMTVRFTCCPAEFEVMGWLPIALLGVELAVRNHSWLGRATGWGITSVAMSQILAAWLGQGGHYASLAVGGYIVYRTLLDPPALMTVHRRVTTLVVHSVAIGGLSLTFAAAALFPRLEFLAISSLADGYPWVGVRGGMPSLDQLTQRIMGRTSYYAGVATLALAGIGVLLGRRRHAAPFFALLALVAALLSLRALTPLHHLLHVTMPRFEDVSRNLPERSLMVFFLAVAMLAGIAVESLAARSARGIRWVVALAPVGLLALLTVARAAGNPYIGPWTLLPILAI